tara:strand:- start:176 stop:403 length:228 start_codon:yes stop_codon:yes gene_type:complete
MTDEKKIALRNSMAGKKVSELKPDERELYDAEFKYKFSPSDTPVEAPPVSNQSPQLLNLPSTMEFLSRTARLSAS